jgi:ubiquitin-protein ligase E3 C
MFQTFSGNSRRPRQVNLSGQNTNPFAASTGFPSGLGTQQTVANAQQERQHRQQERERLNASKRIQRTWRGHRARRELADSQRILWDQVRESSASEPEYALAGQLRLLLSFFSHRRREDLERLTNLSQRIIFADCRHILARHDIQVQVTRLAVVSLEALEA